MSSVVRAVQRVAVPVIAILALVGSGLVSFELDVQPVAAVEQVASRRADPPVATTVTLTSSVTEFAVGQSVTLTAVANQIPVGGYRVRIFDTTTLQPIKTCTTVSCSYTGVPFVTGGSHVYVAEVSLGLATVTYGSTTDVQAFSADVEVARKAWTVALTTDKTSYATGETFTLTATANQAPGSGAYTVHIFDQTNGHQLKNCTTAVCVYSGAPFTSGPPHTYVAEVSVGNVGLQYGATSDVQATSNPVTVSRATWTVTLTTSQTSFDYLDEVTWTATANQSATSTYQIRIFDKTTGALVRMCNDRAVCTVTQRPPFHYGPAHLYIAEVATGDAYATYGQTTDIQAVSNEEVLSAAEWTVSLTGSTSLYDTNQGPRLETSLTAHINQSLGASVSSIRVQIINVTANTVVGYCNTGNTCVRADNISSAAPDQFIPYAYVAYVSPSTGLPYPTQDVLAISNGFSASSGTGPNRAGESIGGVNPSEKSCQCSHADPVNTATGEFYLSGNDIGIPGVGPTLSIGRSYSTASAATDGAFGYGWMANFDAKLVVVTGGTASNPLPRSVKVVQENGSVVYFTKTAADLYSPDSRVLATLSRDPSGAWTFTRKAREIFHFTSTGVLDEIEDLHTNSISISRDGSGRVSTLTTADGRALTLSWTGTHVVGVTDSAGRSVAYTYDTSGNLKTVTAVDGAVTQFTYASGHYLQRQIAPDGGFTENTYDSSHRVVKQVDPLGQPTTFAYTSTTATITYPDASVVRETYENAQLVSQTRAYGTPLASTTSYVYDQSNNVISVTDPLGELTSYTYDSHGNKLTQTDPLLRLTSWTYNGLDQATSVVDAAENSMLFTYNTYGDMLSLETSGGRSQSWTYNADGTTASWVDNLGNVTTYVYDGAGRQTSAMDPDGRVSQIAYDSAGRVTSTTDPGGNATSVTSDPAGRILTVTNPEAEVTTYDYDSDGNLTSIEDPGGHTTVRAYDVNGQLLSTTDPTGSLMTATYTPIGQLATRTDGEGNITQFAYDSLGRLTSVVDPLNRETTFEYDLADRRTSTTLPSGSVSSISYDDAGQVVSSTDADGQVTHYVYNDVGQMTQVTDPLNRVTTTTYNDDGKVDNVTYPDSSTEHYTYDAVGQTTGFENADGRITTYEYTDAGLLSHKVEPGGMQTAYAYDSVGRLHVLTRPDGSTSTYTYDAAGRTTKVHENAVGSTDVELAYDADGRRTEMSDVTGTTSYSYDDAGRLLSEMDGGGASLAYAYDDAGRLATMTYPNLQTVAYGYDAAGQMTSVTDWLDNETTFAWNEDGQLESQTDPNGTTQSRSYDLVGRTTGITTTGPTGSIADFSYDYDHAGQLTSDSILDPISPSAVDHDYGYDRIGQLTETDDGTSAGTYAASSAGALTQTSQGDELSYNSAQQLTSFAPTSGPSISFGYDDNGARTQSVVAAHDSAPSLATTYGYGASGTLASVDIPATTLTSAISVEYTSDGNGLRQTRSDGTTDQDFVWQNSRGLPLLIDDGVRSYIYGPGIAPIAQIGDATGTVSYLHGDLIGSTRVITDSSGNVVGASRYDEYGKRTAVAGAIASAIGYSGAWTDVDTKLVYLRARDYDPSTMQFLTVDPAVDSTRQPYAYVANNPLNQTDPTGLDIWQQAAGLAAASIAAAGSELLAGAAGIADSFTGGASSALLGAVIPGYDCFISEHSVAFTAGEVVGTVAQVVMTVATIVGTAGAATGLVIAGVAGRLAIKTGVRAAFSAVKRLVLPRLERAGLSFERRDLSSAGARLAQDVRANPVAPKPLPLDRPVGLSQSQNAAVQDRVASLRADGATDIRVNQQQVNINGTRVGINRPDLQYSLGGQRYYEEFDIPTSRRGPAHQERILANDPTGIVNLFVVP